MERIKKEGRKGGRKGASFFFEWKVNRERMRKNEER